MSLAPLFNASPTVVLHAFAALAALLLGLLQFAGPKGTPRHRVIGWAWVLLLAAVALSSFWIHGLRQFGPFSLIHLLSILTLVSLPGLVLAARGGRIAAHRRATITLFVGALLVAGAFTLAPGRIMHAVVFGG